MMNNKIFDKLDELNIEYKIVEHPAASTMEDLAQQHLESHGHIPKNLVLRDVKGTRNMIVVLHGNKRANLQLIRDEIDSTKLSFASDERLMKYLSVEKGSVSALGIIFDTEKELEVYFDADLKNEEILGCHPNDNTATVFLRFYDLKTYIENSGHRITFIKV